MTNATPFPRSVQTPAIQLATLVDQARRAACCDPETAAAQLRQALGLIAALAPGQDEPVAAPLTPWPAVRLARYVDEHLTERLDAARLAAIAGLSMRQVSRLFKASFGLTPAAYVQRARLARAQNQLLTHAEPLSSVAAASGFGDEAHLCRAFRQATGQSPMAWRRREAA